MSDLSEQLEEHSRRDDERFDEIGRKIDALSKKLDPILDVYKAVIVSKSFIGGLALVVASITAIGAGFIWLVNSVIHK